ncbi:MAG: tetratricopeptide repeat protein, partial [Pseudomonadota bacterium]
KRKAGNVTLWEAFQRAMWHFYRINDDDSEIARKQLTELTSHSPAFAGGHAALAILQLRRILSGDPGDMRNVLASAQQHATKAVELDDGSSMARIALSRVYQIQGKYDQAVREAETAISLNPNSSIGYLNLAGTLFWGGRSEDAIDALDKSIRLSPKGPMLPLKKFSKGMCYYFIDRYEEAETLLKDSQTSPMIMPFADLILSVVFVRQNRLDDAKASISEARELRPKFSLSGMSTAWHTLAPRYRDKLLHDLKVAGLPD